MAESVKILIGPPLVRRFRNQRACGGCAHPLNSNFLIILKGLQSEEVQSIRFSRIEGVGPTATEARPFAGSAKARFDAVPPQLLSPQAHSLANLMTFKGDEPPFRADRQPMKGPREYFERSQQRGTRFPDLLGSPNPAPFCQLLGRRYRPEQHAEYGDTYRSIGQHVSTDYTARKNGKPLSTCCVRSSKYQPPGRC